MSERGDRTSVASPRAFSERRELALLWFALLAGPVAWAVGLSAGYLMVTVACDVSSSLPLHLINAAALLLALSGGLVSWRAWARAGREWPGEGGDPLARSRFMAVLGLLASGLFALVLVGQWLAVIILHPCMGV